MRPLICILLCALLLVTWSAAAAPVLQNESPFANQTAPYTGPEDEPHVLMTVEGGGDDYGVGEMAYGPLYIAVTAGTVLAAAGLIGIVAGVYWYVRQRRGNGKEATDEGPEK